MKILVAFVFLALTACSTLTPKQNVYQIESEYEILLVAANTYKHYPPCGAGAPVLCSDPAIIAKLQQADAVAGPAIFAAQATVRDPNFDKSKADAVLVAANQALAVLTTIMSQVKK